MGSNFVLLQGPRVRGALVALAGGLDEGDTLRVRPDTLFTIDPAGEQPQLRIAETAIALAPDLAPQLQALLARGHFAMTDFVVEDRDDLRDTVETLVAYGLLERT